MPLFDVPVINTKSKVEEDKPSFKLKKGQTIVDLIATARKLVEEKLGKYKDTSRCVTDINELKQFFETTNDIIAIDTETTGLNIFSDQIVGLSVCNGKECLYVPLNHRSPVYMTRLRNQLDPEVVKQLLLEVIKQPRFKWVKV